MWDAVIVGARCGGSSTALLLARRGFRVLLVDRAAFPSDTLSTHFLWPRGSSYLNRWGLLERTLAQTPSGTEIGFARDDIHFLARTPLAAVAERLREVHGDPKGAVDTCISVRRIVLDKILLDAALEAGAEFRSGVTVQEVLFEEGRAIGIAGILADGTRVTERARIVIGADGRHSQVARSVAAAISAEREEATFAYWTYFSGMPLMRAVMEKRGRLAVVIVPTNFGANMTLLFGPKAWFPRFRRDLEGNYLRAISFVNPELGERVRAEGRREERFYGIADQRGFKRACAGLGWLLIGDAACVKDQCTAIGMTHAFRDAELAAAAIGQSLSGQCDETTAFSEYADRRESDLKGYYEFVCQSAGMPVAVSQDLRVMRGMQANRASADAFAAMYGDSMRVEEFAAKIKPRLLEYVPAKDDIPSPDGAAVFEA